MKQRQKSLERVRPALLLLSDRIHTVLFPHGVRHGIVHRTSDVTPVACWQRRIPDGTRDVWKATSNILSCRLVHSP
jgi:hypothetical protein